MAGKAPPQVSLQARALRMLARREHSRLELARKLARYTGAEGEIDHLLDKFEQRGWLSEKRVVEQTLAIRRGRFGTARITHELREKGISEDAIAAVLPQLEGSELEAARSVWQKKFDSKPTHAPDIARQIRFLQNRGFSMDIIRRVLRDD